MAIDRSKFKPTSIAKVQQAAQEIADATGRNRQGRPGMLDITVGKNKFRIYPGHPKGDEEVDFALPSVKTFLPMMVDEKNREGEVIGLKEGSKPIFNSRIHGGTPKDLVEEYIKLARQWADTNWDPKSKDEKEKNARQKYLDKIYGKYSPSPTDRQMGIQYKTNFVMYADKIAGEKRDFGRLEVKGSVKDRMNVLAAQESDNDPLGVDPYTDLDNGKCIVIHYDDKAKKAVDYYITSVDSEEDKTTGRIKRYPIDDARLEEFGKAPTLESMYVDVFKRKDFELQLKGLEFFDNKYDMGIFGTDEFQEVVQEIDSYYSEEEEKVEEVVEVPEEIEEPEVTEDQYSEMDRNQLKLFNAKNKLSILVKPSMDDETIREAIREAMKGKEIEQKPLPGEKGYVAETVIKKEVVKPAVTGTASARLAGLRKTITK